MSNPYTAHPAHETASDTLIRNSILISVTLAIFGFLFALLGGLVALWVAGQDFAKWTAITIIAGFALAIASLLVKGWENARWVLVETIAANISKTRAEANRIDAEADAISGAGNVNIQTVNAGEGAKVKAQLDAPRVSVRGKAVSWNQVNQLNQVNQADTRRIEIPAADVRWIVEQLANGYGHSKSKWVKARIELPHSRLTVTYDVYKTIMDALTTANPPAIIGRDERASGKLIEQDPAKLVKLIEQSHPDAGSKGIIITLPAPPV